VRKWLVIVGPSLVGIFLFLIEYFMFIDATIDPMNGKYIHWGYAFQHTENDAARIWSSKGERSK
tara:strand:- start:127103 stop:127294 length:192 start_codon:yes stop_codon:yes gene_type:complete